MIASDWLWVARERALGDDLLFTPFSSALGAVMAPKDSPIHALADLKGKSIGVAGGPIDKSWLMLRALALRSGADLAKDAKPVYGAPPLIAEKFAQGEIDAALEYLELLRRPGIARLSPRDRHDRRREGAGRRGAGGDHRLCVQVLISLAITPTR